MRALRVMVRETRRTDLLCIACGQFRTELEVVVTGDREPQVGLHKKCVGSVHHKRAGRRGEKAFTDEDVAEEHRPAGGMS